jgi:hypothetical protein
MLILFVEGATFCSLQVGISLVGSASLMSGEGSASQTIEPFFILLGMILIVLSQVSSSVCVFLKRKTPHPLTSLLQSTQIAN